MSEPIHILSLGAGVQSSTLALMAAAGEIGPMPTCAIFADTQVEPKAVYDWLDWLETQLPFPVYRVTAGNLWTESIRIRISKKTGQTYSRTLIPAFVDQGGGKKALLGRKCTAEFKVREIVKKAKSLVAHQMKEWRKEHRLSLAAWGNWVKEKAAAKKEKRAPNMGFPETSWQEMQEAALVEQWIGISRDEIERMKPSREPWSRSAWPLVEKGITRKDCLAWMKAHGFPEPPRSACRFCPFHSDEEWVRQRENEPEEFALSVQFERELNASLAQATGTARLAGAAYLHESMKPLDQVNFNQKPSHPQLSLFGNECEGMCGV